MSASFALGSVRVTMGVVALRLPVDQLLDYVTRHGNGDWGDVDSGEAQANADALATGARLLSEFTTEDGIRIWIITEADRESTTVLLPSEY